MYPAGRFLKTSQPERFQTVEVLIGRGWPQNMSHPDCCLHRRLLPFLVLLLLLLLMMVALSYCTSCAVVIVFRFIAVGHLQQEV